MKFKNILLLLCLLGGLANLACLWDNDTLAMERRQFPTVIELLSGKFLRHSPAYYLWKIETRKQALQDDSLNLALYDDLSVAYSKIGEDKKAINVILQKDKLQPNLYETEANLGTFYLHDGDLAQGIKHISNALKINPEAHFGRERYQLYLAEYIQSKLIDGKLVLPLSSNTVFYTINHDESANFYTFIVDKYSAKLASTTYKSLSDKEKQTLYAKEKQRAVYGVLGMMRFGNHDSPILLEALGDLLIRYGSIEPNKSARQLAARAYLKASYQVQSPETRKAYQAKASSCIAEQRPDEGVELELGMLESLFQQELKEGNDFYNKIKANELKWIKEGKDLDQAFSNKYYINPELSNRKQTTSFSKQPNEHFGEKGNSHLSLLSNHKIDSAYQIYLDSLLIIHPPEFLIEKDRLPNSTTTNLLFPIMGGILIVFMVIILVIMARNGQKK